MNPPTARRPRTGADRPCVMALLLVAAATDIAGGATAATPQANRHAAEHPADRCAALAREMARLDSRMRAGYGGKTGEAMRDRRREAVAEFHRLRCRGLGTR